jgi:hypothetical protein
MKGCSFVQSNFFGNATAGVDVGAVHPPAAGVASGTTAGSITVSVMI